MTSHTAVERTALCELFDAVGPDAPTLCEGWTTRDLAAHLAMRERVPAAWPGIALGRFAGRTERIQAQFTVAHPYDECVAMIRGGAPAWSPMGAPVLGDLTNLIEYVVHHEDVRRAQPDWVPRAVPTDLADAIWTQLRVTARPMFRRAGVGVRLRRSGTEATVTSHGGEPAVEIVGDPVELLMYASGRRSVARVDLHGEEAAVARLATARLGM